MGYRTGNAYDEQEKREAAESLASLPAAQRWLQRFQATTVAATILFLLASVVFGALGILG